MWSEKDGKESLLGILFMLDEYALLAPGSSKAGRIKLDDKILNHRVFHLSC